MQILQWLLNVTCEQSKETSTSQSSKKKTNSDPQAKRKHVTINKQPKIRNLKSVEETKVGCGDFKLFALLCREDIAKACFHSTINLHRLGNYQKHRNWSHHKTMKKEDVAKDFGISKNTDSAGHSCNKVLPITELTLSSTKANKHGISENKDSPKEDKAKNRTISRMKELLRWAAATKSKKSTMFNGAKVLNFRNRGAIKGVQDDDKLRHESPKSSFRQDEESCTTITSTKSMPSLKNYQRFSPLHDVDLACARQGNWITTDSEFVVLEL